MTPALELLYGLVLEDGRTWGAAATEWQRADAHAALDPDGPRLLFLTRARGGSKTSDLAGVVLAWLLEVARSNERAYGAAASQDQAALLIDAIRGFAARTPGLAGAIRVDFNRVTALDTGATFDAMPADGASAFGRRPSLLVVDELAQWAETRGARRFWEALVSSQPKMPARLIVLTSAGDPAHWSHKVLQTARDDASWYVNETPGPVPWLDDADLSALQRMLTDAQYTRLVLNRWASGDGRLVSPEQLAACLRDGAHSTPRAAVHYAAGLDVGVKVDRTVLAIAHGRPAPDRDPPAVEVVVDKVIRWDVTRSEQLVFADLEAALLEMHKTWRAEVLCDPWQAYSLMQRVRRAGVRIREHTFNQQSNARLATTLFRLVREGLLILPDDDVLLDEFLNVRLIERGGMLRLDHDGSHHDDQVIAIGLAAMSLVSRPAAGPVQVANVAETSWRAPHEPMRVAFMDGTTGALSPIHRRLMRRSTPPEGGPAA